HAHVERDLGDARHLHRVAQPELLPELLAQLVVVEFLQSGHDPKSCASDVHRLAGRLEDAPLHAVLADLEADAVALLRLRVEDHHVRDGDRHLLVHDAALDRGTAFGFGRWCFFATLMPSTITRRPSSTTWSTVPRRPRSLPAMTTTWSPFLIFLMLTAPLAPAR